MQWNLRKIASIILNNFAADRSFESKIKVHFLVKFDFLNVLREFLSNEYFPLPIYGTCTSHDTKCHYSKTHQSLFLSTHRETFCDTTALKLASYSANIKLLHQHLCFYEFLFRQAYLCGKFTPDVSSYMYILSDDLRND